jgi:4,5-dihydroxyphthalate decarboxylase
MDGRVVPEGIELDIQIVRPGKTFQRMLESGEFDVCEMSLSTFAILKARGECPFVGLPVPLSKIFRHSCIYVRNGAGISKAADLKGRRVGTPQYSATGIVFLRGLLKDEYGVLPEDMQWFTGGLNKPGEKPRLPLNLPVMHNTIGEPDAGADVRSGRPRRALRQPNSLSVSERFALGRATVPELSRIGKKIFRRTGIFPIMHIVVIRNDVFDAYPQVASACIVPFARRETLAIQGCTTVTRYGCLFRFCSITSKKREASLATTSGLMASKKTAHVGCTLPPTFTSRASPRAC